MGDSRVTAVRIPSESDPRTTPGPRQWHRQRHRAWHRHRTPCPTVTGGRPGSAEPDTGEGDERGMNWIMTRERDGDVD
jgi:hypothetical protein